MRLCVETNDMVTVAPSTSAAASVRLCVETTSYRISSFSTRQPPPCGCVLKHLLHNYSQSYIRAAAFGRLCVETLVQRAKAHEERQQPPSGGCVLKQAHFIVIFHPHLQPPSGGCVLKQARFIVIFHPHLQQPSGGCVLKLCESGLVLRLCRQSPSGGCVLKHLDVVHHCTVTGGSRLRAAVC